MTKNLKYQIILGFAAIYLIWGSTYLAIRLGVETIPPFLMAGVRFILGGLIFYFWGKAKKADSPKAKHWISTSIVGLLLLVGGNGLVSWAEEVVPSGITALIIAMVPMWIVLIDWIRPNGNRPRMAVVIGLILGFIGVGALINPTNVGGLAEIDHFGAMLLILATIFWASGSVYSKYADMPKSQFVSAGMQMFSGGIILIILSMLTGEFSDLQIQDVTSVSILSLIYLITFGSVGYGAYIWLLKVTDPSKVATYAYVNPVIALILGNLIAMEPISSWTIVCSIVILAAVIIIITSRSKRADIPVACPEVNPQPNNTNAA